MRLSLNAILSLFVASFLLAASPATAATVTATINSISATGVGATLGDGDLCGQYHRLGDHTQAFRAAARGARVSYSRKRWLRVWGESRQTGRGLLLPVAITILPTPKNIRGRSAPPAIAAACRCWWFITGAMRPKPSLRPILQWRRFAAARSWFILAAIIILTLRRRWAVEARALPAA
jgi:hypothetical protein